KGGCELTLLALCRSTFCALSLPLDDVVYLNHLRLVSKLDPSILKYWHEAFTKRVELLARVPDLTDPEVALRTESDVVGQPVRRPVPLCLKTSDRLGILLISDARPGVEASEDACRIRRGGHVWPPSHGLLLTEPSYNRTRLVQRSPDGRGI